MMNQLQSLIGTVITASIERAAMGATKGDLVHGLLAGLRRIRTVVGLQSGYGAACAVDDSIHDQMLERSLETFGAAPVGLPQPGAGAARAAAILEDAAMTCVTLNGYFPGNTAMTLAVWAMTERMLVVAGGVPHWRVISALLRCHEAEDEDVAAAGEEPWAHMAMQ